MLDGWRRRPSDNRRWERSNTTVRIHCTRQDGAVDAGVVGYGLRLTHGDSLHAIGALLNGRTRVGVSAFGPASPRLDVGTVQSDVLAHVWTERAQVTAQVGEAGFKQFGVVFQLLDEAGDGLFGRRTTHYLAESGVVGDESESGRYGDGVKDKAGDVSPEQGLDPMAWTASTRREHGKFVRQGVQDGRELGIMVEAHAVGLSLGAPSSRMSGLGGCSLV